MSGSYLVVGDFKVQGEDPALLKEEDKFTPILV